MVSWGYDLNKQQDIRLTPSNSFTYSCHISSTQGLSHSGSRDDVHQVPSLIPDCKTRTDKIRNVPPWLGIVLYSAANS